MRTWQTEVAIYLSRLRSIADPLVVGPPSPANFPTDFPLETMPTMMESIIYRGFIFNLFAWYRTQETTQALISLWSEGYLSSGAALVRLPFEIWGATRLMSKGLQDFLDSEDIESLSQTVNKLFEGVRSEVLLPWGIPASERPIHVLDAIRALQPICPQSMEIYEDLCESAHANQPRFIEWWVMGKAGGNWSNESVQKRGHKLLKETVDTMDLAVSGVIAEVNNGMSMCGQIYSIAQRNKQT